MTVTEPYRGSTDLPVYMSKRHKEPHFVIRGCTLDRIDKRKVREYLRECDWTDKGSPGWVTPSLRCDEFMK